MIKLPSIVLIDDQKEELDQLQESFNFAGYPYFPIHYKSDDPQNDTGIDHVNLEMIKPRIIITDLNLQEQQQLNAKHLVAPIARVLKKLQVDGPYLLYFWSKNGSHVEEVINLIVTRYKEIPLPIHWGILDKSTFKTKPDKIKQTVANILADNSMFNALFGWENRVSIAAQATIDSLFKLASTPKPEDISAFQNKTTIKLQEMLAVIGNETLGSKNAKEEPNVAVEQGLTPVLHDHIQSNYEHIKHTDWLTATDKIGTRLEADKEIKAHLNSFYHVEELKEHSPKNKRGTWIAFKEDYLEGNQDKVSEHLGRNIKTLINEEFLNCEAGTKETRKDAHAATKLGFIELSAECDQAQRKTKLHRYFLSAMIPIEHEDFTKFRNGESKTKHNGIYRLPNIIINGKEYIVKISFMYQIGTIPDVNKWLGNAVFKLKEQILADISYQASQHAARPGIIRFD